MSDVRYQVAATAPVAHLSRPPLPTRQLAAHAASITSHLLHANVKVRLAGLTVLGCFNGSARVWVAPAMVACLADTSEDVRRLAVDLIRALDDETLGLTSLRMLIAYLIVRSFPSA